jgi:glycosyl transferase family 2
VAIETSGSFDPSVKGHRMSSPRSGSEPQALQDPLTRPIGPRIEAIATDAIRPRDRPRRKPTLGRWPYVAPSLSVINQCYPDLEYIMVDGASYDSSSTILDKYQRHFSALIIEPDDGQSHAINKGMAKATGAILA